MSDQYLWDGTGERDPEIARLEGLLAGYRYREKPPRRVPRWMPRWVSYRAVLAIAASVLLIAGASYWANRRTLTEWQVAGHRIAEGQTMVTGATASMMLRSEFVGELRLEPNSRLQVLRARNEEQRLSLQRGTMHALIWAPPARFTVDTPSARTVDLGCAYTLTVLDDGSGLVTVETGWVAFQSGVRESFIPAGAACRTRSNAGPGIPYFQDASDELRSGLARFDRTAGREGLEEVLAQARSRDGLTLWHLAVRTSGADRERVVAKFAAVVPGVDSEGLVRGDRAAIDAAWNTLGLGGTDWWRGWKHPW
jgi:hypothetical protein